MLSANNQAFPTVRDTQIPKGSCVWEWCANTHNPTCTQDHSRSLPPSCTHHSPLGATQGNRPWATKTHDPQTCPQNTCWGPHPLPSLEGNAVRQHLQGCLPPTGQHCSDWLSTCLTSPSFFKKFFWEKFTYFSAEILLLMNLCWRADPLGNNNDSSVQDESNFCLDQAMFLLSFLAWASPDSSCYDRGCPQLPASQIICTPLCMCVVVGTCMCVWGKQENQHIPLQAPCSLMHKHTCSAHSHLTTLVH